MSEKENLRKNAVKVMNENPNGSMPAEFVDKLRNLPIEVTKKEGTSSRVMNTFGGGFNSLVTITHRYETEDETDEEVIDEAFQRLEEPIPPQCKKLFNYDGSWRNVEDKSDYEFVEKLELVRGDDGFVLYARFQ